MPIYIASAFVPKNNGLFYLLDDKYIRGGFQVVADNVARDAIFSANRKQGMVVLCKDSSELYQLQADLTTWELLTTHAKAHAHASADIEPPTWASVREKPTTVADLGIAQELNDSIAQHLNNIKVASGAELPASGVVGELFFKAGVGLHVHSGTAWVIAQGSGGSSSGSGSSVTC